MTFRAAFVVLVVAAGLVACGPAGRTRDGASPRPLGAPQVTPGSLSPTPLLGDIPAKATQLGAGPVSIIASGPLGEGDRVGAFVDVPQDACLLTYGRAAASLEDIDLAIFADEGSPLAVDEGPDPRPTLLLCPPHPNRVYVAAHAAGGEGMCVVAAQLVSQARAPQLARALNARGGAFGASRTPEAWPGLDAQVRKHRALAGGTWEEIRRVAVGIDARAVAAVALPIEEGGCADVLVVPDDDVAMVDVDVLDGEGRIVARAKDSGPARSVTLCSPIPVAASVELRPHVGRGLVAVVLSKAKAETTRELALRPDIVWVAPSKPIEATRAAREAELTKSGYGAATSTHNGQLQLGRRATVALDLVPNVCTRLDVVAGAPLALVDASAWDDGGTLLANGEGADGATMFACGKGKARIDLGTRGRPGPYAVLARPEKWKDPAFSAHPLAASRMLSRIAASPGGIYEGAAAGVRAAQIDASHQYMQNTSIPPGKCLRVAVGAEGEGTGLDLRLFDAASGEELDRAHGQTSAAVRACTGSEARSVNIEARASAGKLSAVFGSRLVAQ